MTDVTTAAKTPTGHSMWPRFLAMGTLALLGGLAVSNWLDRLANAGARGVLQAQTTAITAGRPAQLAEILQKTGQVASPGDALLRLTDERLSARIIAKQQEVVTRESELKKVEAQAEVELQWRKRDLQADAFEVQLKLAAYLRERLNRQVEQVAWKEHLTALDRNADADRHAEFLIAPVVLSSTLSSTSRLQALLNEDATASALEALSAQIALCEQRLQELSKLGNDLEAKVRISAGVDVAHTRVEQARAELAALAEQSTRLTILSPGYGTVGVWKKQPGDAVAAGDVIVELLDEQQRFLVTNIPSASAGRYPPATMVTLRFPGRVRRTGVIASLPPQTAGNAAAGEDASVPIRVLPTGRLWPNLPIGSHVVIEPPR